MPSSVHLILVNKAIRGESGLSRIVYTVLEI